MLLRFVMEPSHKMLLYVVIALTSVSSLAFFFVFVFQCSPVSLFWERIHEDRDGRCMSPLVVVVGAYAYSSVCIICDWTMALLPWFIVRKTRMDLRTKTMVVFVLAMGSMYVSLLICIHFTDTSQRVGSGHRSYRIHRPDPEHFRSAIHTHSCGYLVRN